MAGLPPRSICSSWRASRSPSVRAADAIRFATPEYNYSAWQGKPVAVLSASVGVLGSSPTRRRAS